MVSQNIISHITEAAGNHLTAAVNYLKTYIGNAQYEVYGAFYQQTPGMADEIVFVFGLQNGSVAKINVVAATGTISTHAIPGYGLPRDTAVERAGVSKDTRKPPVEGGSLVDQDIISHYTEAAGNRLTAAVNYLKTYIGNAQYEIYGAFYQQAPGMAEEIGFVFGLQNGSVAKINVVAATGAISATSIPGYGLPRDTAVKGAVKKGGSEVVPATLLADAKKILGDKVTAGSNLRDSVPSDMIIEGGAWEFYDEKGEVVGQYQWDPSGMNQWLKPDENGKLTVIKSGIIGPDQPPAPVAPSTAGTTEVLDRKAVEAQVELKGDGKNYTVSGQMAGEPKETVNLQKRD